MLALVIVAMGAPAAFADGWAPGTQAPNVDSVANTRHNLTFTYNYKMRDWVSEVNNRYGEVCVYCHTPHGANSTIDAPLWNRTNPGNTYTLYNTPLQSGQEPTQPGTSSLTCLSCHDGTVALDSIINMPGSGRYSAAQETSQNDAFLDTWDDPSSTYHLPIGVNNVDGSVVGDGNYDPASDENDTCMGCHDRNSALGFDFGIFTIGLYLRDDHPVGVKLPNTTLYDFKAPTGTDGTLKFFDGDGDGRADNNEVRFYDTGEGYEVECASCHDPHGVDSAGPGSEFIPSFLRVNNNNASSLCLTCHDK